jgi:hypothetical protein
VLLGVGQHSKGDPDPTHSTFTSLSVGEDGANLVPCSIRTKSQKIFVADSSALLKKKKKKKRKKGEVKKRE